MKLEAMNAKFGIDQLVGNTTDLEMAHILSNNRPAKPGCCQNPKRVKLGFEEDSTV